LDPVPIALPGFAADEVEHHALAAKVFRVLSEVAAHVLSAEIGRAAHRERAQGDRAAFDHELELSLFGLRGGGRRRRGGDAECEQCQGTGDAAEPTHASPVLVASWREKPITGIDVRVARWTAGQGSRSAAPLARLSARVTVSSRAGRARASGRGAARPARARSAGARRTWRRSRPRRGARA